MKKQEIQDLITGTSILTELLGSSELDNESPRLLEPFGFGNRCEIKGICGKSSGL
jgi:hypothetical protein